VEEKMTLKNPDVDKLLAVQRDQQDQASTQEADLLARFLELTSCIDQATCAIGANDLAMFEGVLARQQMLISELSFMLRSISRNEHCSISKEVNARIRQALNRNRSYLLLLQRAKLHAQSLQRLSRLKNAEHYGAETSTTRCMKGRYV
jgi:hypothetical protein